MYVHVHVHVLCIIPKDDRDTYGNEVAQCTYCIHVHVCIHVLY